MPAKKVRLYNSHRIVRVYVLGILLYCSTPTHRTKRSFAEEEGRQLLLIHADIPTCREKERGLQYGGILVIQPRRHKGIVSIFKFELCLETEIITLKILSGFCFGMQLQ